MSVQMTRLGDIADDLRSGFACGVDDPDGMIQFRMNNVERDGTLNWTKTRRVPQSMVKSGLTLQPGDILLNATNSPELVGKTALFAGAGELVTFSNHFIRLRTKTRAADPAYVARWLRRQFGLGNFKAMCRSWVNQASITRDQVSNLEIPLPPLEEQKRIAAILDKADALRAKRRQAIALLDSLTQSIFLEMFGDPVSNPKGWPQKTVGDLNVNMTYGPRFYNEQYSDDGIPIVRITDLSTAGYLDYSAMPKLRVSDVDLKEHKSQPGDILFARTGATVGKAALIREEDPASIPGAYFIRMRFPSNTVPEFAWATIRHPSIQKIIFEGSRQSAQQNFSGPGLRRLPFTLPPFEAQERFAQVTRRIREFGLLPNGSANRLDSLFASLQHRAFTGQL